MILHGIIEKYIYRTKCYKKAGPVQVTIFWGPSYDDWEASAMVKATLEDGCKLTAKVTVYSELNIYINEVFKEFTTQYITADMNDLEKAEKAAWYIGATTEYKYYTES